MHDSSRWLLCVVHDVEMEIIAAYEHESEPDEYEWVIWACPDDGCPQSVVEMLPSRPLAIRDFTSPRTMGRDDI